MWLVLCSELRVLRTLGDLLMVSSATLGCYLLAPACARWSLPQWPCVSGGVAVGQAEGLPSICVFTVGPVSTQNLAVRKQVKNDRLWSFPKAFWPSCHIPFNRLLLRGLHMELCSLPNQNRITSTSVDCWDSGVSPVGKSSDKRLLLPCSEGEWVQSAAPYAGAVPIPLCVGPYTKQNVEATNHTGWTAQKRCMQRKPIKEETPGWGKSRRFWRKDYKPEKELFWGSCKLHF